MLGYTFCVSTENCDWGVSSLSIDNLSLECPIIQKHVTAFKSPRVCLNYRLLFRIQIFCFRFLLQIVGVSCEEAAVENLSSDSSWNGVSCSAQVCPSRPGCQELHVRH